jgi:hypothetical protein
MLSWIIQISIVSIIFIFLVHHLIGFFKSTLTVPKIKDLVNSPSQKYQYMFDTISKSEQSFLNYNDTNTNTNTNTNSYTAIDLLPTESQTNPNNSNFILDIPTKDAMKDELKSFLKKQMNTSSNSNSNNNNNNNNFLNSGMGTMGTSIINSNML